MGSDSLVEEARKLCPDLSDDQLAELQALAESYEPGHDVLLAQHLPSGEVLMPASVACGTLVLFVPPGQRVVVTEPSKAQALAESSYAFRAFGVHGFQAMSGEGQVAKVTCETPAYVYSVELSRLLDEVYWGWVPGSWSDEFEGSLLELLVATNEDLEPVMGTLLTTDVLNLEQSGMGKISSGAEGQDLIEMVEQVREGLQDAMTSRDPQAIGRLHQIIFQLLEISSMMPFPGSLKDAMRKYERAKLALSDVESIRERLRECAGALETYLDAVGDPSEQRLRTALTEIRAAVERPGVALFDDVGYMNMLRPSPLEMFLGSMRVQEQREGPRHAAHLPRLAVDVVLGDTWRLDEFVDDACETLLGDALTLESILGRKLDAGQEEVNSRILLNLLRSGFGYVVASGRVMPLLDMSRACLILDRPPPRKVAVGPEVASTVSFRISTAFEEALLHLKEHHKHSWVGPELESLWKFMLDRGEMEVMELWVGDKLVAADFGHPAGNIFYVATRFFLRSDDYKKLQPGFLLAIVAAKALREAGFTMFDLGGVDKSPMMSYKPYVADTMQRPVFIDALRDAREAASLGLTSVQKLKRGVVLSGISEADLFGAK